MAQPSRVTIVEVGPRDGFQMEDVFIPTTSKVAIVNAIADAGLRKIEVTSFVSPKIIPQLQDAAAVLAAIDRTSGFERLVLVPNLRGARAAIDAGADVLKLVLAVTETANHRNVRMTVADSVAASGDIAKLAFDAGRDAEVVIAMVFGCPFEGNVSQEAVLELASRLCHFGYIKISLADTVGVANPTQVRSMVRSCQAEFPHVNFSLHLHNTRGLGLANALAALDEGIDTFDSSIGGLGGCPVVPGGSGNICTEDLVNMLHEMGIKTGVDLQKVKVATRMVAEVLRHSVHSYIGSAGTRAELYEKYRVPFVKPVT